MAAPKQVRVEQQLRQMRFNHFKVFSGNANPALAGEICYELGCPLAAANVKQFSDGEVHLHIQENVRGADVFVVQPTCTPTDRHLMELLLMMDALKRASAERITAVLPYYGYARQDRKDRPRMPISARLVASLIERAGADRILALDLHAAQIQGFFDVPVDHLFALPVMIDYFSEMGGDSVTVVSPDAGGVERARAFAKRLGSPLAIIDKRRTEVNVAEVRVDQEFDSLVEYNCLPNLALLGKKLGKQMAAVSQAVKAMNKEQISRFMREGQVELEGHVLN